MVSLPHFLCLSYDKSIFYSWEKQELFQKFIYIHISLRDTEGLVGGMLNVMEFLGPIFGREVRISGNSRRQFVLSVSVIEPL